MFITVIKYIIISQLLKVIKFYYKSTLIIIQNYTEVVNKSL